MYTYYHYLVLLMFMLKGGEVLSSMRHMVRCTRRFTAGYCEAPVRPVWTFVLQNQDCVMRMGCPAAPRENRFRKYKHCMARCKVLVDLYTEILINDTAMLRSFKGSPRRDIDGKSYVRLDTTESEYPEEYEEAQEVPHFYSDDNDPIGDVISSNVDGDTEIHTFLDVLNDNIMFTNKILS